MGLNQRDSTACFCIRNNNDARERERDGGWSATRPSTISHKRGPRLEAGCEMHNIVKFHYRCNNAALIRLRKTTGPSLLSYSRVAVRCFRSAFNGTLGRPGGPLVHVWSRSKKGPRSTVCVYMRVCMGRTPFPVRSFFGFCSFRPRALEVEGRLWRGWRRGNVWLMEDENSRNASKFGDDREFVQFWKVDFDLDT